MAEVRESFPCFGGTCTVIVDAVDAAELVAGAKRLLLEWHRQFSRFEPDSELSALNASAATTVAISPLMRRILEAAIAAAHATGGLVDPTLAGEIEQAGYASHFEPGSGIPLRDALAAAPERRAAQAREPGRWRAVAVDRRTGSVARKPGVRLDPGGIAKGVFADELAARLRGARAFAVDCAGDIRLGGGAGVTREVQVEDPFDGAVLHAFALTDAGVATSGIGRRSWHGADGLPAHHLLDPASGRPAFTGVVQATAIARTAAEAEARSKAALLSGPGGAERWLRDGGVVVLDDGSHRVYDLA